MHLPKVTTTSWLDKFDNLCRIPLFFIPMIAILGIGIPMCFIACTEQSREEIFPPPQKRVQNLSYYKDEKSNLCFVENSVSVDMSTYYIYTNVPCTPEVEKLLVK